MPKRKSHGPPENKKKGRPRKASSAQDRKERHKSISRNARLKERERILALKAVLPEIRDSPKCNKARVLKCSANAIRTMKEQVLTLSSRISSLEKQINDFEPCTTTFATTSLPYFHLHHQNIISEKMKAQQQQRSAQIAHQKAEMEKKIIEEKNKDFKSNATKNSKRTSRMSTSRASSI